MPADGKFTLLDSGKLAIRDSGKADVCDDCCEDCETCPSAPLATFAGVDAAMCVVCQTLAVDVRQFSLSADGAYTLSNISDTGSACGFSKTAISGVIVRDSYSSSDGTCTNKTGTSSPDMQINITWDKINCRVNTASFGSGNNIIFTYNQAVHGGSFGYGDAIPNALSCTTVFTWSDGGTLTLTR